MPTRPVFELFPQVRGLWSCAITALGGPLLLLGVDVVVDQELHALPYTGDTDL